MSISVGIIGLPNVGKSTLFNALTRSHQANVQNYPFCTIDPNVGVVEVPDERLKKISQITKTEKVIPTVIEFVDIAGLVAGASKGEGLGNQFLSHIREVDAIVQVVRAFADQNVAHITAQIQPAKDAEIVNLELVIADLNTIQKRLEDLKHAVKNLADKDTPKQLEICEKIYQQLESGQPARSCQLTADEQILIKNLNLLTIKPIIYAINVGEGDKKINALTIEQGIPQIEINAKLEAELADLSPEEARQYLQALDIQKTGLEKLITASYQLLNLITFYTFNEKETRAWTVKKGTKAPKAAGVIHTDFIKGFIKADVVNWQDFVELGGWSRLKESGKLRLEGKGYIVQDGDVIYFHVHPVGS